METPSSQPLKLCYCYAYEDRKYSQALDTHLTALKMSEVIQMTCYNCEFYPHGPWKQEAAAHINTAHLVLLLVSAHFLRSGELYRREIAYAMERHDRGEARVIPIFLRDVDLEGTYLSELRMLPNNHEFISSSRDKDRVYADIARKIRDVAIEMRDTVSIQTEQSQHEPSPLANELSDLIASPHMQSGFLSISWSPLATWLAVGAADGSVRLYNVDNYDERDILQDHASEVYSVAWSASNLLASSSADRTVRLWNASEKRVAQILPGHTGTINSVAWSPDGKQVASGSADKTIHLWDAGSGRKLRVLSGHRHSIMSVAWSPDSKLLASSGAHDHTVRLWDAKSGRELPPLQDQTDVMSVAWSPDGKLLATGSGNHVRLWDISIRSVLYILSGHTSTVTAVAWSPDGKSLASSSYDQTVCLWDPSLGKKLRTLQGHIKGVVGIAWSPDGKLLATVSHDELYVWSTETWGQIAVLDNQQVLRKIIRQPSRILRTNTTLYDYEAPGEFQQQEIEAFQQQEMEIQKQGTLKDKQALVCPDCHTPLPEKEVNNRRKRGLTDISCGNCQTSVPLSLLASQEQTDDKTVSGSAQPASEGAGPQNVQAILQRKIDTQAFGVFFCYNHQDKPAVQQIGEQLKRHGILPWIDEWELRPGESWQRAIEEQIRKTKVAAVFIGPQGMGPWHDSEMYAILRQMKKRDCRVIPVLLPGIPEKLELPIFLEEMFWVDFRLQEPDPLQQLLRGITWKK